MEQKSDKEYVKIPKKDFEEIYEEIKNITTGLDLHHPDLKYTAELLTEIDMRLDEVLNKEILDKLELAERYIRDTDYDYKVYYHRLKKGALKILSRIKKEQIDEKQNE